VSPDGSVAPLSSGWQLLSLRALDNVKSSHANGMLVQPWHPDTRSSLLPVKAGKIYALDVEIFPTLATLARGHSLRLALQTVDEPHSNGSVGQTTDAAGGTVTVYSGGRHRSTLVLGIEP
jgi:uncharacterized protein